MLRNIYQICAIPVFVFDHNKAIKADSFLLPQNSRELSDQVASCTSIKQ